MTIGIYKIENSVNGKVYIGSSVNIEKRWAQHKSILNKKSHTSKFLQKDWNNHGCENFIFEIIEDTDDLAVSERYWIQFYKDKIYNDEIFSNRSLLPYRTSSNKSPTLQSQHVLVKMNIKKLRLAAGLSQVQLAEMVGRTVRQISDWETQGLPSIVETLELLYKILGERPQWQKK